MQGNLDQEKAERPDFGTYHHSTSRESAEIRRKVKALFVGAFAELPFPRDAGLRILDVGCGLGFLSCVCAEFYPNAVVIGFDTFEHASLKGSSLEKAKNNARILGLSRRIDFRRGDIFLSDYSKDDFDLIVSNLVFHNLGRKRFEAYERLYRWVKPNTHVILGEFFFDYKSDLKRLSSLFSNIMEWPTETFDPRYKLMLMSRGRRTTSHHA